MVKKYNFTTKLFEYYVKNNTGEICEFIFTLESIKAKDWYIIEEDEQ